MNSYYDNGINFIHNNGDNVTFALWSFDSRKFSFIVESKTSIEGAYDELIRESKDGVYNSVLSSKGVNNQYETSKREQYNLKKLTDQDIISTIKTMKANDCYWDSYFKREALPNLNDFIKMIYEARTENYIYPNMDSFLVYWLKKFKFW